MFSWNYFIISIEGKYWPFVNFILFLQIQQISSYHLVVSGTDNDGTGLSTQCECSIKVKDVNDNFPVLRDSQVCPLVLEEPFLYVVNSLASQFTNYLFVGF